MKFYKKLKQLLCKQDYSNSKIDVSTNTTNSLIMKKYTREMVIKQLEAGDKDFSGCDLSGLDLSSLDLSYANFHGADLINVNLCNTNLTHTILHGANLFLCKINQHDIPILLDSIGIIQ